MSDTAKPETVAAGRRSNGPWLPGEVGPIEQGELPEDHRTRRRGSKYFGTFAAMEIGKGTTVNRSAAAVRAAARRYEALYGGAFRVYRKVSPTGLEWARVWRAK